MYSSCQYLFFMLLSATNLQWTAARFAKVAYSAGILSYARCLCDAVGFECKGNCDAVGFECKGNLMS